MIANVYIVHMAGGGIFVFLARFLDWTITAALGAVFHVRVRPYQRFYRWEFNRKIDWGNRCYNIIIRVIDAENESACVGLHVSVLGGRKRAETWLLITHWQRDVSFTYIISIIAMYACIDSYRAVLNFYTTGFQTILFLICPKRCFEKTQNQILRIA